MFTRRIKLHILIIIASACFLTGNAQDKPAPKDPVFVENKGFEGKVFEIKHREPNELVRLLTPLGSGFKGATISHSNEFKSLSVRDFPENLVAIEAAIKRLDVATPVVVIKEPDLNIEMHVLLASNIDGPAAPAPMPSSLNDVVKQLQNTLSYKNYHLLTSLIQRGKVNLGFNGEGTLEVLPPLSEKPFTPFYAYGIRRIALTQDPAGATAILLDNFQFTLSEPGRHLVKIATSLSLKEGEKVVVGTSSLGNKAIVLVFSAKLVK